MSYIVQIVRAKPNPRGKDTNGNHQPLPRQLVGEWVDLRNTGDQPINMSVLNVAHSTYTGRCVLDKQAEIYWSGDGSGLLQPGEILRVHAGKKVHSAELEGEDRNGANHHAFTEQSRFVLNNDCGDRISVWWKNTEGKWHQSDSASYDANPTEGKVLIRNSAGKLA